VPELLQPLVFSTKGVPFGPPAKAVELIKEMNQKWCEPSLDITMHRFLRQYLISIVLFFFFFREGMDSPVDPNNPWESVSGQGRMAGAYSGAITKRGTPEDPYTPAFGAWRYSSL
jgi:hypothetical protein